MSRSRNPNRQQSGFTMLEVLITIVILSVGLLGMAALQGVALSRGTSADQRAQATNLAAELIDMVRANRSEAQRYAGPFAESDCGAAVPVFGVGTGSVALPERAGWIARAQCLLPGASGNIAVENGRITVTLAWADSRWEQAEDEQATTFIMTSEI